MKTEKQNRKRVFVRNILTLFLCIALISFLNIGCEALTGEDGADGINGIKGETGDQGPPGYLATDAIPGCAGCIKTESIEDGAVDRRTLAPDSVDENKLANGAVTEAKLTDLAVGSIQMENYAVTSPKLADLSVGSTQILNGSITGVKIGDTEINVNHIADGAITDIKLADNAISNTQIQSDSIYNNHVPTGSLNRIWTVKGSNDQSISGGVRLNNMVINVNSTGAVYMVIFDGTFVSYNDDESDLKFRLLVNNYEKARKSVYSSSSSYKSSSCGSWCNMGHSHQGFQVLGNVSIVWAGYLPAGNQRFEIWAYNNQGNSVASDLDYGDRTMTVIEYSNASFQIVPNN